MYTCRWTHYKTVHVVICHLLCSLLCSGQNNVPLSLKSFSRRRGHAASNLARESVHMEDGFLRKTWLHIKSSTWASVSLPWRLSSFSFFQCSASFCADNWQLQVIINQSALPATTCHKQAGPRRGGGSRNLGDVIIYSHASTIIAEWEVNADGLRPLVAGSKMNWIENIIINCDSWQ